MSILKNFTCLIYEFIIHSIRPSQEEGAVHLTIIKVNDFFIIIIGSLTIKILHEHNYGCVCDDEYSFFI